MKELTEANILNKEISDLEYFIHALDVELWRARSNVKSVIKKQIKTSYSIFGYRPFWSGAHEQTINVPTSMIPTIVIQAKELLRSKETELSNLFTPIKDTKNIA
jgi:hypothetical protein